MIERRRRPAARRVALRTGMAEIIAHMIRIADALIIILVTGPAIARRVLIAARVAVDAVDRRVPTRQREGRLVVIERRRRPAGGRVAAGAIVIKAVADMIRIADALVIILVTGPAIARRVLIAACVAVGALHALMFSG